LMLESVEKRFGDQLPATPVQWLSDNGSAYTAEQTRLFARQIGLQPGPPQCAVRRVTVWQRVS
jgi:putative transposase